MFNHIVGEAWQLPVAQSHQPDNASQATPLNLTGSQPSQTFQRSPARFHSFSQPTQSHHSGLFTASQPNNILHTGPLVPERRLLAPRCHSPSWSQPDFQCLPYRYIAVWRAFLLLCCCALY